MMEESRPDAVAARVVAWHNRHPLAHRLNAAQVLAVGVVTLPFIAPADAAARPVTSAFSEDFLPPLRPAAVARWALVHGVQGAEVPPGLPVRAVAADGASATVTLQVLSAAIEVGARRGRVLLAADGSNAVMGQRLWSRPRLIGLGAGVMATLALAAIAVGVARLPATSPVAPVLAVAPAASAAVHLPASAPGHDDPAEVEAKAEVDLAVAAAASEPASDRNAALPLPAASAVIAAVTEHAPLDTVPPDPVVAVASEPGTTADDLVPPPAFPIRTIRTTRAAQALLGARPGVAAAVFLPLSDEERVAARESVDAARARVGPSKAPAALPSRETASRETASHGVSRGASPSPSDATLPGVAAVAATSDIESISKAASGPAFALSTRRLRTRAEAEQVKAAMVALLNGPGRERVLVEILAAGDDWQVAAYPYDQKTQAERARTLLESRGMRVGVIAF